MTTAEAVIYLDPVLHRYIHVETGRVIPSVSSILRKAGVREAPWTGSGPRGEAVAHALKRGTEVHRLTRAMDETNDLADAFEDTFDPANLTVENLDYVSAYDRFMRTSGYRSIAWEAVVYNPPFDYAGKPDAVGWLEAKRVMIDRKTDKSLHRAVWLQLAAYKEAWNYWHPNERIDQTYALVLKSDMSFSLVPNPIEDGAFAFFTAAIWMAKWHDLVL